MVSLAASKGVETAANNPMPTLLALAVVGIGGYLLVSKAAGAVVDLAGDAKDAIVGGAQDLAEGTGDFFSGFAGGADPVETPITGATVTGQGETLFRLSTESDPGAGGASRVQYSGGFYDLGVPTSYRTYRDADGQARVQITDPNPAIPAPYFYEVDVPSLATRVGAEVRDRSYLAYGPLIGPGLAVDALFDYNIIEAPKDAVQAIVGAGETVVGFFKGLF